MCDFFYFEAHLQTAWHWLRRLIARTIYFYSTEMVSWTSHTPSVWLFHRWKPLEQLSLTMKLRSRNQPNRIKNVIFSSFWFIFSLLFFKIKKKTFHESDAYSSKIRFIIKLIFTRAFIEHIHAYTHTRTHAHMLARGSRIYIFGFYGTFINPSNTWCKDVYILPKKRERHINLKNG